MKISVITHSETSKWDFTHKQLELKLLLSGSVITSDGELGARALIHTDTHTHTNTFIITTTQLTLTANLNIVVTLKFYDLHYGYYVLSPEGGRVPTVWAIYVPTTLLYMYTHTYWDPLSDLLRKLRIWLLAVMWWTVDVGVGELNALISWFDVTVYVKHRVQRPAYVWITKRNVLNRTTKCIWKKKGLKFLQLPAKHEEVCLVFSILSQEPFEHYETRTREGTHPPQYYVVLYVDV